MKTKRLFTLLLALLVTACALAGCSESAPGGAFASFTANTLDGGVFDQESIKSKDLTIVNFWGMFCGPCRAEMPDLAAYAKALPENVQLITICIDALDDPEGTKEFLRSCGYEGVTLLDGDDGFNALVGSVQLFPTTIFVNGKGEIVGEKIEGGRPDLAEVYTAAVNKALAAEGKAEISVAVR